MPAPIKHTFTVLPVQPTADQPRKGRKPAPKMPPLPKFDLSDFEQQWYDYFWDTYNETYPDLTRSDKLLLMLAGVEFIKYLRVVGAELASGEVISQARQHPGTQMNALLDRLSVTRKARQSRREEADDPNAAWLAQFAS